MSPRGSRPIPVSRRAAVLGLGAAAFGLTACEGAEAPVDDQGRVRLRFAADGPPDADQGGFYQALASGGYARRGLNVQIMPGGAGLNVPQRLASGEAELGLGSSSFVALNLVVEGAPVRAVAAYFQKDLSVLLAPAEPPVEAIEDLAGRSIRLSDPALAQQWAWLKTRFGFTDAQLQAGDDPEAVLEGELTTAPSEIGVEAAQRLLLADAGYPAYGALVLAPNAFARDNARALRGFIAASAEGWRDYLHGDPDAAHGVIRRLNPALTPDRLETARQRLAEARVVDGGDAALFGIGAMTHDRWRAFFEAMSAAGVYPAGLDWRRAWTDAYLPGRR